MNESGTDVSNLCLNQIWIFNIRRTINLVLLNIFHGHRDSADENTEQRSLSTENRNTTL